MAEDAKQVIQEEVDYYYELFVEAVGRNRGITSEEALTLADGKVYIGKKAVQVGLVDGLRSFESFFTPLEKRSSLTGFTNQQTKESKNFSSTTSPEKGSDNIDANKEAAIKNKQKEAGMDITLEKLKAENKDIVDALISEGKEAGLKEGKELSLKQGKESGVKEERERATQIFASMPQGMTDLAIQAVKEGKTSEQAKDMFLAEMKKEAPPSPGPGDDAETNKNNADKNLSIEERCKKEWEKNPKLEQEFASLETYTGYRKGIEKGYIKESRK